MAETKKRSLLKTITWRITATLTVMILVFVFTGRIDFMLSIGIFDVIFKAVLYFVHERVWNKITWGYN